ncbi:MAG: hypothetical protein PHE02_09825 [Lachnospiraceae bacterium]|nr:hypothetical protein [Lachnospiraceae bacterium]
MPSRKEEVYRPALSGKKIPLLTLDNKWHRLFTQTKSTPEIKAYEEQLNDLLKRQGKLTNEVKEIKKLKTRLMNQIVEKMDTLDNEEPSRNENQYLEEHKRLINDCNDKVNAYQDELLDIPKKIDEVNFQLMLETMESCYHTLQNNTEEIDEIAAWVAEIRVELKKKLIYKQEKEIMNQELYAYMHDIFGANVIELFDMKYNPSDRQIKKSEPENKK